MWPAHGLQPQLTGDSMGTSEPEPICPVCGYDQSGVIASWAESCPLEGVCSECGSVLRWQEIHRPDLFASARFAEDPRSKKWKGLARTGVRVAFPKRFWAEASRTQPLAVRRLIGSVITGVGLTTTPLLLLSAAFVSLLLYLSYTMLPISNSVSVYRMITPNPFKGF